MGRVKEMLNEAQGVPELPEGAIAGDERTEINNDWLRAASDEEKIDAMIHWFLLRFCDPAYETPYMSSEGGYLWVHGGPYDAIEELESRFGEYVNFDLIERTAKNLQDHGTYEWAPTRLMYSEDYDFFFDDRNGPTQKLESTIEQLKGMLSLTGDEGAREVARKLAYGGVIGALETFLWETMGYWLNERPEIIERIITRHQIFKDKKISLSEIYVNYKKLPDLVLEYMRSIVWHRADQVGQVFKHGLGISIGLNAFDMEIRRRHDIIHRLGVDMDGNAINISAEDVHNLAERVEQFAEKVNEKIALANDDGPF